MAALNGQHMGALNGQHMGALNGQHVPGTSSKLLMQIEYCCSNDYIED